ncbi:uncharacterized protein BDZ83DRAFT_568534 [Colletotrichum acutatum]|uniref:Zn(2)-C6 fungal-type domain-containing protein n=1 Tax=Glomerella acutata TaxID=27357 RepID=A0AAD8XKX3_GLOAC|nr:uncharacterized protein BDZ83DRAFT_568534 [Colletotrichum acutatum]KAK1729271.1 hypothetical protein BDZ83DRAFT_568534 [Colletotrichum acutatum]
MELAKDIYNLLDHVENAKVPGRSPIHSSGERNHLSEDDELFDFCFDYPLYQTSSTKDSPAVRSLAPRIMAGTTALSDNETGSTTETSSILTPEPDVSTPGSAFTELVSSVEGYDTPSNVLQGLPNDPYLFPRLDKEHELPRFPRLLVPGSKKRTRSNSPSVQKRVVKDIGKTNQVRSAGACMRCRIQKVPCSATGVCEKCIKAHPKEPQSSCFREDLVAIVNNSTHQRFTELNRIDEIEVRELLRTSRPQYLEPIYKGSVVFARGLPQVMLPTTLRNYRCMIDGMSQRPHQGCVLSREHGGVPSYQDLVKWAEQMVIPEDYNTFEGSIEVFIKMYSAPQRLRQYPRRPQMDLLDKVHTMKCMYKICCQDDFIFIREDTGAVKRLPLPAKAELRGIARMALETAERDILMVLDKLKAASAKVPEQDLPALWATLWQLMFIYRDLLRNRTPRDNDAGALLNAVAVFYAAHFRTSASLGKLSLDSLQRHWGPGETQQAQLSGAFDHALSLRDTLHRTIAAGIDEIDHRLKALVVDPEMKVLGRRTNKKTSGGK